MTNQEMRAIIKMHGWQLRSRISWGVRRWYIENASGDVAVSERNTQGLALRWAIALITKDEAEQGELRLVDIMDQYNEWKKDNRR